MCMWLPAWHANDSGGAAVVFTLLPNPDLLSIMWSSDSKSPCGNELRD